MKYFLFLVPGFLFFLLNAPKAQAQDLQAELRAVKNGIQLLETLRPQNGEGIHSPSLEYLAQVCQESRYQEVSQPLAEGYHWHGFWDAKGKAGYLTLQKDDGLVVTTHELFFEMNHQKGFTFKKLVVFE